MINDYPKTINAQGIEVVDTSDAAWSTYIAEGRAQLALAEAEGAEVTTVEGLERGPQELHPLQQAFLEEAALQCGICTPGFLVAAKALLDERPDPSEHEVRFWLAGNLCRCTGYDKIIRAVLSAAETMRGA